MKPAPLEWLRRRAVGPSRSFEILANVFAGPKQDTAVMAGTPAAHIA